MRKKQLPFFAASLCVFGLILTGCGSQAQTEEEVMVSEESLDENAEQSLESGKVELTVWAEEDNFDMLGTMIESFKQKYAGQADFEITLLPQSEASTKDTLLGDIHASADIFTFPDDQLSSMLAAGALEPIPNADEISKANIAEAVEAASYQGTMCAYPMTADNGYMLYYDKDYLSEQDVETLEGILAVAEETDKKFSMEFDSGWYLYSFFGNTGLPFGINEDGVTNYCEWNSTEGAIKGTDIAESLLRLTASPAFAAQPDAEFVQGVKDGTVIAGISGVWNAVAVKEAWGEDYGAVKLPTYECAGQQVQMSSFTGYKMMGVNHYSKHRDWAFKLADWFTNEENQTLRFEERSQGPSNINAAASEEVAKVPAIQAIIQQSSYGNVQRVGNYYWDACTAFANTIMAGNPDGKPLQEIMDALVAGITASTVQ